MFSFGTTTPTTSAPTFTFGGPSSSSTPAATPVFGPSPGVSTPGSNPTTTTTTTSKDSRPCYVNPKAISKSLRCSICLEPFFQPVRTLCGHVFCKNCLDEWKKKRATCPLDQQPLPSVGSFQVDFVLAELLSEFEIVCPNECTWNGLPRDLTTHRSVCPNERISCLNPGCIETQPRKEMVKHQESCPHLATNKAVVTLNVGGRKFQTLRSTLMKHENTYFTRLFKGEIPAHFDNEGNYFIDRNGDLFAYALEWLRSETTYLPPNVSRDMFKKEMDFYGFGGVAFGTVNEDFYRLVSVCKKDDRYGYEGRIRNMNPAEIESLLNEQAREGFHPTKATETWLRNTVREAFYDGQETKGLFRKD